MPNLDQLRRDVWRARDRLTDHSSECPRWVVDVPDQLCARGGWAVSCDPLPPPPKMRPRQLRLF